MPITYAQAGINICTDIAIFVLPLPSLLRLPLSRKNQGTFSRKALLLDEMAGFGGVLTRSRIVALILVFSVGSLAVIASIARLSALITFGKSKDSSCEFEPRHRPPSRRRTPH